jgi:predicted ester cyclase
MAWRAALHERLMALAAAQEGDLAAHLAAMTASPCRWEVARPVGTLEGADAVAAQWLRPLRAALPGAMRRDDIVMGGESRTGSGRWLATLGHYVGNFEAPLFGIPPSGKLVFLRCGEFYRLENERIVEARILPDLPDLMRQAGHPVWPKLLGTEMLFPAPASHDGVLPDQPARSDASAALVEAMLADLRVFDPAGFESRGQTGPGGYWHRDMLWYGPAGIGANFTYAGFQRDHRVPFLTAFPDRVGGNHFARFGDGDYVCSGGWPSMTMTHRGDYLGTPATGRAMTCRVMDFWRVQDGTIRENWVLLDLIDLFAQMGVDLLAKAVPADTR